MAITGSDRIFAAALVIAEQERAFTESDIELVIEDVFDRESPSKRTIYSHLDALIELGILEDVSSGVHRKFKFEKKYDPSQ